MALAGTLEIQMLANMARLTADMAMANRTVSNAVSSINNLLGTIGLGASAAGLIAWAKSTIDAADAMRDMSMRLSIGIKDMAAWKLVAEQNGTTAEAFAKGVKTLSVYMVENASALKMLGVTAREPQQAMLQLADVFAALPEGATRSALAVKLLGKSGMELVPAMIQGSAAIKEAQEQTRSYGEALAVAAPLADQFNDQLALFKLNSSTSGQLFAGAVLPALNDILAFSIDIQKEWGTIAAVIVGIGGGSVLRLLGVELDATKRAAERTTEALRDLKGAAADLRAAKADTYNPLMRDASVKEAEADQQKAFAEYRSALRAQMAIDAEAQASADRKYVAQQRVTAGQKATEEATKRLIENNKTGASAYDSIQKKASDYIATLEKETAQLGMNAEQKKMIEAGLVAVTLKTNKERTAVMAAAAEWARKTITIGLATEAAKKQEAATDELLDRMNAEMWAQVDATAAMEKKIAAIDEETFALTYTAEQLREHLILRELETSGIDKTSDAYARYEERLRAAYGALDSAKKAADEIKQQAEQWKSVESVAHSAWGNIEKDGIGSLKRIGDTIKSAVWDRLYQLTVKKWIINVAASIDGTAAATQAFGATGSAASGLSNLASGGSGLYNSFAYSGIGQGLGLSTGAPMSAIALEAIGGESALMAGGAGGLTALGAAVPYIGAAVAAVSLLGDLFGGDNHNADPAGPPTRYGASFTAGAAGLTTGAHYNYQGARVDGGQYSGDSVLAAQQADAVSKSVASIFAVYTAAAQAAGISTDALSKQYSVLVENSDKNTTLDAAYAAALGQLSDQMATSLMPNIKDFQQANETLGATFLRVTGQIIDTRSAWQQKLDIMTGATTQQAIDRAATLASTTDAATVSLMQQVFAQEDMKVAAQAAADAASQAAAQVKQAADLKRINDNLLVTQYQLEGKTAEALALSRELETAGMDASTLAIQQRIYTLQKETAVSDAAAQAEQSRQAAAAQAQKEIDDQRYGLTTQLLQAQGDTAALHARELELTDPANRALQQQVWAVQAKTAADAEQARAAAQAAQAAIQAAQESARAAQQAADEQARAQQKIIDGWQNVANSIFDTMQKLRGDLLGPQASFSQTQADFAIATAAARAGDQTAAGKLPALAQAVVDLGRAVSVTQLDQTLLTARTLASLQSTVFGMAQFGISVPSYAVGTDFVPRDGLAMIHRGEKITPAADNKPGTTSSGIADLKRTSNKTAADMKELKELMLRLSAGGAEGLLVRTT